MSSAPPKKRGKRSSSSANPKTMSFQAEAIPNLLRSTNPDVVAGTLNTLLTTTHTQDFVLSPLCDVNENYTSQSPIPSEIISSLLGILQRSLPTFSIPGVPPPITPESYDAVIMTAFGDIPSTPYDQLPSCPVSKSVLTIFQNLSYVPANQKHMAYHSQLVVTLTTFVQDEVIPISSINTSQNLRSQP